MKRLGREVQLPNFSGYSLEECPARDGSALKARLTTNTRGEMLSRSLQICLHHVEEIDTLT